MSYADRWTDKELVDLERKIFNIYSKAQKDFEKQANDYFTEFAERDEVKRKKVDSGELSKNEYTQWRLAQMGRGERFNHLARQMAERATKANEVAVAYVNDKTPGIYTLNRNHEAYTIESLGHEMVGADFSLYNEQAVKRLVVEDPKIMPYYPEKRAVARGIDLDYGQKYIKRHILGGIVQGKSVYKIADDLQRDVADMNRASAIRTARTAVTAAQNGGRQATMDSAMAMGIKLRKRWVATKDGRTRDVHGVADGQTVPTDEPFIVGGEKMMFPGDRTSASGWNLYNCRCGMRTVEKEGIEAEPRQVRVRNPETGRNELVNDMTYTEWAKIRGISSNYSLTSNEAGGKIPLSKQGFKKINGNHNIADAIGTKDLPTCNPKFKQGGDYITNCGNCVVAYEMRRRGYDVIAKPVDRVLVRDWENAFVGAKPIYTESKTNDALVTELKQKLLAEGNGARGSLSVKWKIANQSEDLGHFFSWEVVDDDVVFVDAQTGNIDAIEYFDIIVPYKTSCLRWDKSEPSEFVKKCCSNRGG